jgi:hypothetical protein
MSRRVGNGEATGRVLRGKPQCVEEDTRLSAGGNPKWKNASTSGCNEKGNARYSDEEDLLVGNIEERHIHALCS